MKQIPKKAHLPSGKRSQFAIENDHFWLIYPLKHVIFHDYVSIPEGNGNKNWLMLKSMVYGKNHRISWVSWKNLWCPVDSPSIDCVNTGKPMATLIFHEKTRVSWKIYGFRLRFSLICPICRHQKMDDLCSDASWFMGPHPKTIISIVHHCLHIVIKQLSYRWGPKIVCGTWWFS